MQNIFIKSEIVWYFIGVYVIHRTLHDHLEICSFSSRVEKYFTSEPSRLVKYFSNYTQKIFCISTQTCNNYYTLCNHRNQIEVSVTKCLSATTPSPFCMSCKISEILVVMKRQVANGVWNKIKVNTLSKRYCFSQSTHMKNYDNFSRV